MASKWCSLGRTPNIYMKTIKKTFRAVSYVPNFTFVFLFRTQLSLIFKLPVNALSNSPCFDKAFKEFKSICPSLICYNLIESSFKYPEAAKFIETVQCFKSYKLLRQILFRTTNKPLDILRTSSLRVPLRPCASKAPIEIKFFFNWDTYLTSFNSLTIPSNNLMWTYLSLQSGMCDHRRMSPSLHLVFQN